MARSFVSSSSEGLYWNRTADWQGSQPISAHVWFYPTVDQSHTIFSIADKDSALQYTRLTHQGGVSGDPCRFNRRNNSNNYNSDSSGSVNVNQWNSGGFYYASTVNQSSVWLNGNETSANPNVNVSPNWDRLTIGYVGDSTPSGYFDGHIAEFALWSVQLTDEEFVQLNKGFSPLMVRPDALISYVPLGGITPNDADYDLIFGDTATAVGTPTTFEHPPIIYPTRSRKVFFVAASGNTTITADSGSFTVSGTAATTAKGYKLTANGGSFTVSGTAATTAKGYKLTADSGSFTVSGTAAATTKGHKIAADSGSFTVSGTAATTLRGYVLSAESGSFTVTGADATTSKSSSNTLTATAGSFTVTGSDASLLIGHKLAADAGSFTVSGADASTERGYVISAEAAAFTVTGADATLLRGYVLSADSGSYTVTGTDITTTAPEATPVPYPYRPLRHPAAAAVRSRRPGTTAGYVPRRPQAGDGLPSSDP